MIPTIRHAPFVVLVLISMSCSKANFGLPRIPLSSPSPDGRFIALVRNHVDIDPPNQSIWVGEVGAKPTLIERLAPDMDYCSTIEWSADSSTVAFVVRNGRLRVVDAASGETLFNEWVVEWSGEYPPAIRIKDLRLANDGRSASFRGCRKNRECSELRTVEFLKPGESI